MNSTRFSTKTDARNRLQQMGLPEAQISAANRAIGRATVNSTIELIKDGEFVIVRLERPGIDGRQVMESIIDATGNKINLQKAFNASDRLVHFDPKTPVSQTNVREALIQMELSETQRAVANRVIEQITPDSTVDITKTGESVTVRIFAQGIITETTIDITGQETVIRNSQP